MQWPSASHQPSGSLTSLNMGSMNFSMHPSAAKYSEWKFDGERDYLSSDSYIFRNTFRDIALVARELGEGEGVKFEHECYDVGHLYNLKFCIDTGMFKPPVLIQFVLGILGNHGLDIATPTEARAMQGLKGPDRTSSDISGSAVRDIADRTEDSLGGSAEIGLREVPRMTFGSRSSTGSGLWRPGAYRLQLRAPDLPRLGCFNDCLSRHGTCRLCGCCYPLPCDDGLLAPASRPI